MYLIISLLIYIKSMTNIQLTQRQDNVLMQDNKSMFIKFTKLQKVKLT